MKIAAVATLVCLWVLASASFAAKGRQRSAKAGSVYRWKHLSGSQRKSINSDNKIFLRISNRMKDRNATSGGSVQFKCKVDGWPKKNIKYTWYKEDSLINPAFEPRVSIATRPWGSRLRIKDLYTLDSALYRCEASNGLRRVHNSAFLSVSFERPPPPLEHEKPILKLPSGKCEKYRGVACGGFLEGKNIYVDGFQTQEEMENQIMIALNHISDQRYVSGRCQKFAVPAFCFFVFPPCQENNEGDILRKDRLCREDCQLLKHDICHKEYLRKERNPFLNELFNTANCTHLPSIEDSSCTSVGLPSTTVEEEECFRGNGEEYKGRVDHTITGLSCKSWPTRFFKKHPELSGGHRYCRNPDKAMDTPWCFVDKERTIMQACNVKKCNIKTVETPDKILSIPTIIAISASGAAGAILLFAVACACCLRRQREGKSVNSGKFSERPSLVLPVNVQQNCVPQLSSSSIHLLNEIGNGEYGKAYKGLIVNDPRFMDKQPFAIKMLSENATTSEVKLFERDVGILSKLSHPSITTLKAISYQPCCMVFDYTHQVSLHEHLVLNSPNSDVSKNKAIGDFTSSNIDNNDFVKMALQIASGMEYLSSNNYIHRDVAARNVLVCGNMDLKICNLGVVRDSYLSSYYRSPQGRLWPVRWMAPESLQSWQFSDKSPVWSFGVLLWEMFSYGLQPYCGYSNHEVLDMISRRQLLTCPDQCPAKMYSLMHECWSSHTQIRPDFKDITCKLKSLKVEQSRLYIKSLTLEKTVEIPENPATPPPRYTSHPNSYAPSWTTTEDFTNKTYFSSSEDSTMLLSPK